MDTAASRLLRRALPHAWIIPILLAALWLRTAGIQGEHFYGDEAEYGIVARYLSRDPTFLAYPDITDLGAVPFVSQPPFILYLMALSMKTFGPTDLAALLPSILFGVATVALVYMIGTRLGGRLMGAGAAAVLAGLPFHVEMSRRAMLDSGYVFFLTLTVYFCIAWLQTRGRRQAVGVGVGVAGAALSKLPGVLAGPVALLVFLVGLAVVLRRRDEAATRETLKQGGLAAIPVAVGALLYLGLLTYLSAVQDLFIKLRWQLGRVDTSQAHVREMTAIEREPLWYFTDPHFSLQHNLLPIVFALALVGLIAVGVRLLLPSLRRPEDAVVPLYAAVILAFFLWSDRKEGFYLLPLAPAAAVFVAYTGDSLRRMLRWAGLRYAPVNARYVTGAAFVAGALLIATPAYAAASETVDDFVRGNDQERYFGYGTKEAAAFVHEQDPEAAQYGTLLGRWSLHWYNEQDTYHWYIDHTLVENRIRSGEVRYVVYENYLQLAFDHDHMRQLIDKYNGEPVATFREGWGEVTVYRLRP